MVPHQERTREVQKRYSLPARGGPLETCFLRGRAGGQGRRVWRSASAPIASTPARSGPRELQALRLVEQRPGITVAQVAGAVGVTLNRACQYVGRLEAGRVRLDRS